MITVSEMFTKLAGAIASSKSPPFDLAVVDEAQDISVYLTQQASWIGSKEEIPSAWRRRTAHES
jgi:hypothetical protein